MIDTALEALHVAAKAIRKVKGIKSAIADNDNTSGEIIFDTEDGETYILRLESLD